MTDKQIVDIAHRRRQWEGQTRDAQIIRRKAVHLALEIHEPHKRRRPAAYSETDQRAYPNGQHQTGSGRGTHLRQVLRPQGDA